MGPRADSPLVTACWPYLALALALLLGGCKPGIGDACTTSTDCSQTGDRLCDISQPSGYCTIYNCEPAGTNAASKCPDDAACIAFGAEPSLQSECATKLGATPYQRTFCLKKCDNSNDCRSGYVCADPRSQRADVVDVDGARKVCLVAASRTPLTGETEVCTAASPSPDAGSAASGGAGPDTDGQSGGGGAGGH